MDITTAYDHIERCGIMAALRGSFPPDKALPVCEMLFTGGITVFEFTYNSERAVEAMVAVKNAYGDQACVGMGTVLDVATAERVIAEGADFVVSPGFQPEVVRVVNEAGILMAPGCLTPTEILAAWAMDVRLIKLFPIGALGVDHFRQLRGPLNHIKFMCNGGTNDTNVGDFIAAGAVACGLGSWLTGDGAMPLETISQRAHQLRHIVDHARAGTRALERA
jgi:2-dehydro-3-deoxyphosphogluconate aldolase/(4S)-4-hydroxy-2-oxoglutarate aldolase